MKSPKEILDAINKTQDEIKAILAKSMPMPQDEQEEGAESPEDESAEHEGSPEGGMPPEEGGEFEGAPEEGEMPPEGQEGGEDHEAALAQQMKEMSDEELDQMLEMMMAEKEGRSQQPQGQPQGQPQQDPGLGGELTKSMNSMAQAITTLTKEVQTLKQKPAVKISAKPAAANIKTLEKSAPVAKRLAKSDTFRFLEGQIRAKNPIVTSKHVAELANLHDDDSLAQFQDRLSLEGLKFPEQR